MLALARLALGRPVEVKTKLAKRWDNKIGRGKREDEGEESELSTHHQFVTNAFFPHILFTA
jgi:hypothetical protein